AAAAQVPVNGRPPELLDPGFQSNPDGAIAAARERVAAGDFEGAIRGLRAYVAVHPNDIAPTRLLGDLYYRQTNLSMAERTYRQIIILYPGDRETHNRLGAVYATQNRIDEAITEYSRSLPGTDSVADLVSLHQRKGDLRRYQISVERDASNNPSDGDVQGELGSVYLAENDYPRALQYFLKELDLHPASALGINHAAITYMDLGLYTQAFAILKKCIAANRTSYACTLNLAAASLETHDYASGKELLDRAQQLEPEHPEININFGYLADAQGRWKEAVTYYVKALAVSPFARDAYLNLGVDYERHKLYDLAESALIKGLSLVPSDGELHYLLGRTYQAQSKHDLARKQFEAAYQSADPRVTTLARVHLSQLDGAPSRQ
ncbi:MAG: tetratricopeptide repeat protein, partial [Candidatus Eremiobacteraeota bacterium]|nr:tetratricopeptide repeat protein [Candidatus Eremiobacteraeota bacterium]